MFCNQAAPDIRCLFQIFGTALYGRLGAQIVLFFLSLYTFPHVPNERGTITANRGSCWAVSAWRKISRSSSLPRPLPHSRAPVGLQHANFNIQSHLETITSGEHRSIGHWVDSSVKCLALPPKHSRTSAGLAL
jgi:hypothetical protein